MSDQAKVMIAIIAAVCIMFCAVMFSDAQPLTASWYSVESCLKESGQFTMANGKEFKDEDFTCASWDYDFGTRLRITNALSGKAVIAVVSDRGPNKRLYARGRVIDLSKMAFAEIADLRKGVIEITIKELI